MDSRGNRTAATCRDGPDAAATAPQRPTCRVSSPSSHTSSSQGSTPSTGTPVSSVDPIRAGPQQVDVASELVDHEPADQRPVGGVEQRDGAVERGEHAAPVDVADYHHGQRELLGQTHVHVVASPQVDLGGRSGALGHDHVVAGRQLAVGGERGPRQMPPTRRELARLQGSGGRPRTTTNDRRSDPGLSSTGFIADSGTAPAACACRYWARPISAPSRQTIELFDMFCALNGATRSPCRARNRQIPAVTRDLPASDEVPATSSPRAGGRSGMVGTRPTLRAPIQLSMRTAASN